MCVCVCRKTETGEKSKQGTPGHQKCTATRTPRSPRKLRPPDASRVRRAPAVTGPTRAARPARTRHSPASRPPPPPAPASRAPATSAHANHTNRAAASAREPAAERPIVRGGGRRAAQAEAPRRRGRVPADRVAADADRPVDGSGCGDWVDGGGGGVANVWLVL